MLPLALLTMCVYGTGIACAGTVSLDGAFGHVEIDTSAPALMQLILKTTGGQLDAKSILSPVGKQWLRGVPSWGTQAYTYAVDADGVRYESRIVSPDRVERLTGNGSTGYRITGIKLVDAKGHEPVAIENWLLTVEGDDLVWRVERTWLRDITLKYDGVPAIFYSNRPWDPEGSKVLENCVASTIWYDPDRIDAWFEPSYRVFPADYKLSLNNMQVVKDPDAWAIFKLWTNWHNRSDLKLAAKGAYLYRRGFFGWIGEGGAIKSGKYPRICRKGTIETTSLRISWKDKASTGYQLAVDLPDDKLETTMRSFYSSLLNGGVVNDQKNYDFGNETDGWYYNGSPWMQGFALSAGVPAPGRLSSHPYDVANAFRRHLEQIFGTIMDDGRSNFGYDPTGNFVDSLLNTIIGTRAYMVHSGDLAFVRQYLPTMEKMIAYFISRRNTDGLFDLGGSGHWYYDAMPTSGVNSNHNALFYKALLDIAEMESACGRSKKSAEYAAIAPRVKDAFNRILWYEDAPGGPRYCDWITPSGEKVAYCADVCQFQPVALGIASPEQAKKLIATIDRRIVELKAQYAYAEIASLSAYWPVPDHLNPLEWQRAFPVYMNCGSFMAQTYWEIMARVKAGDIDGAYRRMSKFSEEAAKSSFMGNNWMMIDGKIGFGASDEPYLSDMIVVPAAIVNGFLGIKSSWDKLEVNPSLPAGWKRASADIVYKGRIQHISVDDGKITITPGKKVVSHEKRLFNEIRAAYGPEWQGLTIARHFATGSAWKASDTIDANEGRCVTLKKVMPDDPLRGLWKLDERSEKPKDSSVYDSPSSIRTASGILGTGVRQGAEGHSTGKLAYSFDGSGYVDAGSAPILAFGPDESFTVQCRFKTSSTDIRVMASKPGAYCLYVKDGKPAAWIMQDGLAVSEALGSSNIADGKWHHAAAVYDRKAQRLSLYLDGRIDAPDGQPSSTNPADITGIGLSTSASPFCIGGLGVGYLFIGSIDEVSVHKGTLRPEEFSYAADYPAKAPIPTSYHSTGEYVSAPSDWGSMVQLTSLKADIRLNGGTVEAVIEASDDAFKTVKSSIRIRLKDGEGSYSLKNKAVKTRSSRVRLVLSNAGDKTKTPAVTYLRVEGVPSGE